MARFNVTYEIVTPESAEEGDAAERGFVIEDVPLRTAIMHVQATRTNEVDGVSAIEPSSSGLAFDWITIVNGMEFTTGATESRSLHIPNAVTPSSRVRIARLLGARVL